jgi:acetyltransferase
MGGQEERRPGFKCAPEPPFPFRYPVELEEWVSLRSGQRVLLRPYRPGDEKAYRDLFSKLAPIDIWFRFFSYLKNAPEFEMRIFREINYAENLKFVANAMDRGKPPEMIGVVGLFMDPERAAAEFALIVRSDQKRQGLGKFMLNKIVTYARCNGYQRVVADVIRTNIPMLNLALSLGFRQHHLPEEEDVTVCLDLT